MLDKRSIEFLRCLVDAGCMYMYEYFNYFSLLNNSSYELASKYCYFLAKQGYINIKDDKVITPTFQTQTFLNYLDESKFNNFFVIHILPYIQQLMIFILGLSTPFLLKTLKKILELF